MNSSRIEYFDFLRGIAIIMVVGIHTFVAYPIDTPLGVCSAFFRQVLNCAVPIFLALSGFFLGTKSLNRWDEKYCFWKKQIPKVYIPALIWSFPYFIQNVIQVQVGDILIKQVVALLVCAFSIYYFIALIVQYYFLLPMLQKYKHVMMPISVVVSFFSILLITYISSVQGIQLPLIVYAGPFTTWFVFFMLGVYYSSSKINYTIKQAVSIIVFGFALECIETYWLNTNYGGGYGIKFSAFIYSIGVVMFILSPKVKAFYTHNKLTSLIAYVGNISFGVYLIHCFVIRAFNFIYPVRSWLMLWIMTVIITSIICSIVRTVLPKHLNRYLGFL